MFFILSTFHRTEQIFLACNGMWIHISCILLFNLFLFANQILSQAVDQRAESWGVGVLFPVGVIFNSIPQQPDWLWGFLQASYWICIVGFLPVSKAGWAWNWPITSIQSNVKESGALLSLPVCLHSTLLNLLGTGTTLLFDTHSSNNSVS
jgi:hypothetical protein